MIIQTMHTDSVIISWEFHTAQPEQVTYFINGEKAGDNDAGFDKILQVIKTDTHLRKVILKGKQRNMQGGGNLQSSLPFSKRFDELKKALGTRQLVYELL